MSTINFILFYNGQQPYDNKIIQFNTITNKWSISEFKYTEYFGNFYPHKFNSQSSLQLKHCIGNKEYIFPTSEHAYQASKCANINEIDRFTNPKMHAGTSFKYGRKIKIRADWENIKNDTMGQIIFDKFTQNKKLADVLLATNDAYLIEHTPFKGRDKWWADDFDGSGKNHLGIQLMKLRETLDPVAKVNPLAIGLLPKLYEWLKTNARF